MKPGLFSELKRRNVYRAAILYVGSAWALAQGITQLSPVVGAPPWIARWFLVAAVIAFPFWIAFAWLYQLTAKGLRRESDVASGESITRRPGRKLDLAIMGVLAVAVVLLLTDRLTVRRGPGAAEAARSIAVLPFDNLTGDTAQDYFVAGMRDALVGALGQVSPLRVTWGSLATYLHTRKSDEQIGRELGVAGLVRGSVLRSADSVQYQVRLIQATPQQRLLWSHTYSRPVHTTLALNGEVARAIAAQLRVDLTADQTRRLSRSQEMSPAVYEAFLRGMYYIGRQRPTDVRKGLRYLEDAVAEDPGNAQAWAGLAQGYAMIGHSPASPADVWHRARAAAQRAVRLDPNFADAQAALADVKDYYDHDWAGAEAAFRRANELNPNLAFNHAHYAFMMFLLGRSDEALAEYQKAVDLDPLTPIIRGTFAWLENWTGHPEAALRQALVAFAADSLHPVVLTAIGDAYLLNGDTTRGLTEFERAASLSPPWKPYYAAMLARTSRVAEARHTLAELEAEPVNAGGALFRGMARAMLGDMDEAFRWFAHQPEHAWLPWLRVWPGLDSLRRDPRFPALLEHLNLPPLPH
jgi:TolB-like protein/Tfp pilus assembly protein PilF